MDRRREFQLKLQNRFELLNPSLEEEERDVNEEMEYYQIHVHCKMQRCVAESGEEQEGVAYRRGRLKQEGN